MIGTLIGVKYDSEIPFAQMDFQFVSGVGARCPETQAKATVLTFFYGEVDGHMCGQVESRENATEIRQ